MSWPAPPAPEPTPGHPVLGFTRALAGALDRVLAVDPVFMTPEQQAQALLELETQRSRLEALELRVLASADRNGVGVQTGPEVGATSTAAWLAFHTRADRPAAAAKVKLARALDEAHTTTAAGLAAGDYSTAHAAVITRTLADLSRDLATDLPADLSGDPPAHLAANRAAELDPGVRNPGLLARAEQTLVAEAAHLTPRQLRIVGRHLLEVLAPEAVEARERDRLDRADAAAYARARLSMRSLGDGTTQGWFRLPDLHAAILNNALDAITAPRKHHHHHADQPGQPEPDPVTGRPAPDPVTGRTPDHATRLGQAFCEVEHLPVDGYGEHGGLAATLLVTLDHQVLATGLGAAALVDGTPIAPGEARRLACGAGIIPAVLGGPSTVLDLGREARLFSKAQRIALNLRDQGCRAEGCDRPPSWCEAHHLQSWAHGGRTDLDHGILLCGHHHRLAHHRHCTHQRLSNGDLRYHRRT